MNKGTIRERPILFSGEMVRAILDGGKTQTRRIVKLPKELPQDVFEYDHIPEGHFSIVSRHGKFSVIHWESDHAESIPLHCPYVPGEHLWMREAWRIASLPVDECPAIQYRADDSIEWRDPLDPIYDWDLKYEDWFERMNLQLIEDCEQAGLEVNINEEMAYTWDWNSIPTRWRPSIHMPRWASRITLEVTSVRVERIQDISRKDVEAEGLPPHSQTGRVELWTDQNNVFCGPLKAFAVAWDSLNAKRGYSWELNPWVWVVEFRQIQTREEGR